MALDPLAGLHESERDKASAPASPPPYSPFHILPKVGGPFWLLTFLDVISLLLAFFMNGPGQLTINHNTGTDDQEKQHR